ncbi:hypothetical protein K7640_09180 [Micromonospora sp. PLK6-60]|uniref:hypothetical protein n=1 Tax=Micromonospora sp. PLK6-60 TaxID=2873383 RepID=UPI001CA645AF|nr:hypothetical protein [Micromonospora sp. PLK6-60]MBY8872012.1 hypothetical protein [Micromonospora sp. PLK6-60]
MNANEREVLAARLSAKLEPWRIRATLSFAGLYQITHELIKETVIDDVRGFYLIGFDESGYTYDEQRYEAQVLRRDPKRRKMRASLLWLVESGAITLQQADRLDEIYAHRHDLTHELGKYIVDPEFEPDMQLFSDAVQILQDIRRYWTRVEMDLGTYEAYGEVDVDDITPGPILLLQLCIDAYVEGLNKEIEARRGRSDDVTTAAE